MTRIEAENHYPLSSSRILRQHALNLQEAALAERLATNPTLMADELELGIHKEALEPQVRDAVMTLNQKGYPTYSSGFYDLDPRHQTIEGTFRLDEHIISKLNRHGVRVLIGFDEGSDEPKDITILQFRADTIDLDEIKKRWDEIADLLPEKVS